MNLTLSDDELALVGDLLESAQKGLLQEIHHTVTSSFRRDLRARLTLLEGLQRKLETRTEEAGRAAVP